MKRRASSSGLSPSKRPSKAFKLAQAPRRNRSQNAKRKSAEYDEVLASDASQIASPAASEAAEERSSLSQDSPFLQSRIVGTTSAKLSYLISEILKHYQHEKILVFYDGDNAAYYIAQMLDILHIKHEIYAKSLKASLKSEYAVRFDQEAQDRVLLMDVRQAAFGLNLPAASRIYFVNPVCRENIEAQAIKRAHRIGQTKPVHVETLVLKGTIEEKMLDRSKRMTRAEHLNASHLEDDGGIKQIIQSATPLPIDEASLKLGSPQMARLATPQQVWCRDGWREYHRASSRGQAKKRKATADADGEIDDKSAGRKKKVVRRTLAFVDCRDDDPNGAIARTPAASSEILGDEFNGRDRYGEAYSSIGPGVGHFSGIGHLPPAPVKSEDSVANNTSSATVIAGPSAHPHSEAAFRKLSISTLLNDQPEKQPEMDSFARNDLIQDILRRL